MVSRDAGGSQDQEGLPELPHAAESRTTFIDVFAVVEFRALWAAQVLSVAGDQLARVALTLLVYDRTHSALLAAVTFVSSIVPAFVGGLTLSGIADRLPRRRVMIACDLSRAVLVGIMVIPGQPLAALVALLCLVTMLGAPFNSARAAMTADILAGDRYILGVAITQTTFQFAQVVGFAVGGAVVGFFGTRISLLVDAATFILSAAIAQIWVRIRPAARTKSRKHGQAFVSLAGGMRLVLSNPRLRAPMLLGWLSAFYNAPEAIAAPLARSLRGGDVVAGLILASGALGAFLGAVVFSRFVDPGRQRLWMNPAALAGCVVLVAFALRPSLPGALVILGVSGVCSCYQLVANTQFVMATLPSQRSQAFGIALGGMSLGQGVAMILVGAATQRFSPDLVVAATGVVGALMTVVIALTHMSDP